MTDLKYYTTDEFLNLYVKGDKSIDEMLSLDNMKHDTTYRISFLNHLLYLCKTNNTNAGCDIGKVCVVNKCLNCSNIPVIKYNKGGNLDIHPELCNQYEELCVVGKIVVHENIQNYIQNHHACKNRDCVNSFQSPSGDCSKITKLDREIQDGHFSNLYSCDKFHEYPGTEYIGNKWIHKLCGSGGGNNCIDKIEHGKNMYCFDK